MSEEPQGRSQEELAKFYVKDPPAITEQQREVFTNYVGIPEDQIQKHILDVVSRHHLDKIIPTY